MTLNEVAGGRVGPILNLSHPGEPVRESMNDVCWAVIGTAARPGCQRGTLSRLLNGKAGVSARMALALEDIGGATAGHGMRMPASHELEQARWPRNTASQRATASHA